MIQFTVSIKTVDRILSLLASECAYQAYQQKLSELNGRLEDELEGRWFIFIAPHRQEYFQKPNLFGSEIAAKFPSTAFDIEEAGKCLALTRSTACVFHLMRVLEGGLYALGSELGVPFTKQNWQTVIERIEAEIRRISKAGPGSKPSSGDKAAWKQKTEFYAEAAVQFTYLKDAWRNRTAHTGLVYTEEKAESIFGHVREFMQHLATRLKEQP